MSLWLRSTAPHLLKYLHEVRTMCAPKTKCFEQNPSCTGCYLLTDIIWSETGSVPQAREPGGNTCATSSDYHPATDVFPTPLCITFPATQQKEKTESKVPDSEPHPALSLSPCTQPRGLEPQVPVLLMTAVLRRCGETALQRHPWGAPPPSGGVLGEPGERDVDVVLPPAGDAVHRHFPVAQRLRSSNRRHMEALSLSFIHLTP